jgi:DNA-binding response OmpR family regulator
MGALASRLMAGQRILLIEDDLRLAGMLEEYLGKAGFHVVHAEPARAVSRPMRARRWTPSCSI